MEKKNRVFFRAKIWKGGGGLAGAENYRKEIRLVLGGVKRLKKNQKGAEIRKNRRISRKITKKKSVDFLERTAKEQEKKPTQAPPIQREQNLLGGP